MRSDDAACSELHQLLFMVHGIGQHDDFDDGRIVGWDGGPKVWGGAPEFRALLEKVCGPRLGDGCGGGRLR